MLYFFKRVVMLLLHTFSSSILPLFSLIPSFLLLLSLSSSSLPLLFFFFFVLFIFLISSFLLPFSLSPTGRWLFQLHPIQRLIGQWKKQRQTQLLISRKSELMSSVPIPSANSNAEAILKRLMSFRLLHFECLALHFYPQPPNICIL